MAERPAPVRVGILLSGRGSNFLALHQAIERGEVPGAEIARVASNVPEAAGLVRAAELGLPTFALDHRGLGRDAHETALLGALREANVEWVCLAGYMRRLSPLLVRAFPQRILNIHPSLLPAFPGLDAQRQALEYGVRLAGCTVHLVDEGLDSGPIVEQRAVPVKDGDTVETLSARILLEEHQAYAFALRRLLSEPWQVVGRRVHFDSGVTIWEKGVDTPGGGTYTTPP
ncbi:MAG TPA: phosphoribosylglycinamide formyltransferase [Thermoanaerobaculia bacterium]|jgi:phosphoribosylglycinamide formyltransferase-1|nr:phosphoribosylglycinamide formyltransferase [Thermoanaerobaculia bacterium]